MIADKRTAPGWDTLAPRKVVVIGASGSGKTRLARLLASHYALPFRPTDGVFWTIGWQAAAPERVAAWVGDVLDTAEWVLDGNLEPWRAMVWHEADLIVWLDLSWPLVIWQVTVRNVGWWVRRHSGWTGERMTLAHALRGIGHAARSWKIKRRRYPGWLAETVGTDVVVLHSRASVRRWLAVL